MRFLTTLLLAFILQPAYTQNISGVWHGVLTQEKGEAILSKEYAFWLKIIQNETDKIFNGYARIEVANTPNFAVMLLRGGIDNNLCAFGETDIATQNLEKKDIKWCLISAQLDYTEDPPSLSGYWGANDACGTGKITLYRTDNEFSYAPPADYEKVDFDVMKKEKNSEGLKDKMFILEDVRFESDRSILSESSLKTLDQLVRFLKKNEEIHLLVLGHTDNSGDADHNLKLSMGRARAVVNYLISKGIDAERLSSEGYGASRQLADNETETGKAKNRRTEFIIQMGKQP